MFETSGGQVSSSTELMMNLPLQMQHRSFFRNLPTFLKKQIRWNKVINKSILWFLKTSVKKLTEILIYIIMYNNKIIFLMITQQWCQWDIWFYLFYLWSDKCTKCYFSHLGNPQVHIGTLQKAAAKPCQGEPSLQNAMESAVQSLRWVTSWMVLQ